MHIDQSGVGSMLVAPHIVQERLAREHLSGLAGQADEQVELQRRQWEQHSVAQHLVPGHIDAQVADRQGLRGAVISTPHSRAQAGNQLARLEGLDHVVVGPRFKPLDHINGVAARREHDDGNAGLLANRTTDLDAVHPRQHDVKQDDVRLDGPESLHCQGAVGAEVCPETLLPQHDAQHLRQCCVVIDDKDLAK